VIGQAKAGDMDERSLEGRPSGRPVPSATWLAPTLAKTVSDDAAGRDCELKIASRSSSHQFFSLV
jgi:hypothetical protein